MVCEGVLCRQERKMNVEIIICDWTITPLSWVGAMVVRSQDEFVRIQHGVVGAIDLVDGTYVGT